MSGTDTTVTMLVHTLNTNVETYQTMQANLSSTLNNGIKKKLHKNVRC